MQKKIKSSCGLVDVNMDQLAIVQKIFEDSAENKPITVLLNQLNSLLQYKIESMESVISVLVDIEFIDEVKNIVVTVPLYFGKTLRDLKCIIQDDSYREHELCFRYNGPKKLSITNIAIPYSPLQDEVFCSIQEIVVAFKKHLDNLADYFYQLERIDRFCTVMEPIEISFKDEYRRILLDERTWLHVEVTPDGLATNIHLVGQSDQWSDKLQVGLLAWDHDKDIVENIMTVFDLLNFPLVPTNIVAPPKETDTAPEETQICNICLCAELPDKTGLPQPLCQNSTCGVSFHRNCLFQWLLACSGGRPPAFGVATGNCPTCLQAISCSEK